MSNAKGPKKQKRLKLHYVFPLLMTANEFKATSLAKIPERNLTYKRYMKALGKLDAMYTAKIARGESVAHKV